MTKRDHESLKGAAEPVGGATAHLLDDDEIDAMIAEALGEDEETEEDDG